MSELRIKSVAEAQSIAREFIEKNGLRTNDAIDVARDWFNGGDVSEAWRETLTVKSLNAKLASAFLVRKD